MAPSATPPRSQPSRLVLLDRDGVINYDSTHHIRRPEQWIALPGSLAAIARLTEAGFTVAICTNQSGIARGLLSTQELEDVHRKMCKAVRAAGGEIHALFVCPHAPDEDCHCRKPRPGLLEQAARRFGTSLAGVAFIGDSLRDMAAARAAGARPVLVRTGNGERSLRDAASPPTEVYRNLAAAANALIRRDVSRA